MLAGVAALAAALLVPVGPQTQASGVPAYDHVFVIVMENHSYSEIIGSSAAPYINSLLPSGGLATSYYGVTHPSLPNYLTLTGASTYGINSDCTTCWVSATNIADSLETAGASWKAYMESMPSACFIGDSGSYYQKHNPFIYFNDIRTNTSRCQSHVVPYTQLSTDLKSTSTTPSYAFISPNICNDMHDCSVQTGDSWLKQQVPLILGSAAFKTQHSLLALTWDEDDSSASNQVPLILLGTGVAAGSRSSVTYDHYSLLHTIELARGLPTLTSNDSSWNPITDLFASSPTPSPSPSPKPTPSPSPTPTPSPSPPPGLTLTLSAQQLSTQFTAGMSGGTCSGASYEVQQYDSTLSKGWYPLATLQSLGSSAASEVVQGFPAYGYQLRVRLHCGSGSVGSWVAASTAVSTSASWSHPFKSVYTMDGYGGLHAADSPPLSGSAYWPGWTIARSAHSLSGAPSSGAVLDGYGGLHSFGAPMTFKTTAYWAGWKIARDFAFLPDGSGGYVLDGYGGLHPFSINGKAMPAAATTGVYWAGWDIARKVVIFSDGTGGYVLDGWGGIHPFGINGKPKPAAVSAGFWPHWDIIHDFALIPGTHAGYQMDGFGGIHPFAPVGQTMPASLKSSAYWPNWDIARSIVILGGSSLSAPAGYVLDGYGGLHQFGSAPAVKSSTYWGWDIAAGLAGA